MPPISPLSLTSELSAVNRLLSAVGEAAITDHLTSQREDVKLAVALLRETAVEVQSRGWRFNREFGYALTPHGTLTAGAETLNVFVPPEGLLHATLTPSFRQQLQVTIRPPRAYNAPLVFYDRARNRDGFADRTTLYIDPTWYFDFPVLPEAARRYIVVRAARSFVEQHIGASELVGFTVDDERTALRLLVDAEGEEDEYNIFDSADTARIYGLRRQGVSGVSDPRVF
jgi:hypothetical protein